ncbi:MAG: MFS transporter [Candidatus Korobacteraceae bacterium]|jgi:D-galactonate transporter
MHKVSWRLIPFMVLLYFVAFLDRVNVGFAALTMNKDLGLTATVFGNGAGIFFIGYFIFEVPSNVALEKFGARMWIARIMITWGIISGLMALTTGPISFYTLRFLLGIAEAGFFPGMILYLTYWFPSAYRAKIVGCFLLAIPISSIIGAPISTALLGTSILGLKGWQSLFILEALPALVLGFVVLFFMTDKPEKAHWLTPAERDWLSRVLQAERKTRESVHHYTLGQALMNPRVVLFGLMYFGIVIGLYGFSFWLPQIIKGFGGLSNWQVGLITMIPSAFAAAAMYLWGRHSDKTGERVWHVFLPAIIGGTSLAISGFLTGTPALALVALTIGAMGIYAALPTFWTLPTAMLSGTAAAGGIALINSIGNLGGYFGPSFMGYLKDWTKSHTYGLIGLGACMAMSGFLALAMGHNRELEKSGIAELQSDATAD